MSNMQFLLSKFSAWWKDIMDNESGTKEALIVVSILCPVTVVILLVVFWL
jgi:hypothetical protein